MIRLLMLAARVSSIDAVLCRFTSLIVGSRRVRGRSGESASYFDEAAFHLDGAASHLDEAASHLDGAASDLDGATFRVEGRASRVEGAALNFHEASANEGGRTFLTTKRAFRRRERTILGGKRPGLLD
jgi:hypothetical protein